MKAFQLALVSGALLLGSATVMAESINPATKPQMTPMNAQEQKNLEFVLDWWRTVLQGGHMEMAPQYQAEDYIQHNPNLPTGRAAFVNFFENVVGVKPKNPIPQKLDPAPVVKGATGDFVFLVWEREAKDPRNPANTYHYNTFDVVRLENGKIQEHWDSAQRMKLPEGAPPMDFPQMASMADHGNKGEVTAEEQHNIELASMELRDMLQLGHLELADQVMAPDYIQHNPMVPQGRDGFVKFMSRFDREAKPLTGEWPNPPSLTLVSGPYVLMMWDRMSPDPNDSSRQYKWNHFDVLRMENGKVQEHWDEAVIRAPNNG